MSEYVTELRDSDVLFGRGSGPNDHEGNIRFRQYVAARKAEYLSTNHRNTKAKIAREIVDLVISDNGRFLKKMEPEDLRRVGLPEGTDAWMGVDDDTIMEKAKQALRQNTNKKNAAAAASQASLNHQQQPQQQEPQQQQQQHYQQPQQIHHAVDPTLQYTLDDLEPIPIGNTSSTTTTTTTTPTHVLRPSQISMPPPALITGSNWQLPRQEYSPAMHSQMPNVQYSTGMGMRIPSSNAYPENDDMMPYVPSGMMRTSGPTVRPHQPGPLPVNEVSVSNLPASEAPLRNSLSGSLTVGENMESMDIAQLMSSFQSTKISDDGRKMTMSTETMGTIEPMTLSGGSMADMSIATMNSSTFSILKNEDSSPMGLNVAGPPPIAKMPSGGSSTFDARSSLNSAGTTMSKQLTSDSSLSVDLTSSIRSNASGTFTPNAKRTSGGLAGVKEEDNEPLPVDVNNSLGSTALSVLKGMVMSTDDVLNEAGADYLTDSQETTKKEMSRTD